MLYREVERKLDMQFGLSVEFKHKLVSLLEKKLEVIPVSLHHTDGLSYIDLFVHEQEVSSMLGGMSSYKPVRNGDYLVIRLQGQRVQGITEPSRQLLEVHSSLPGELYIKGDRLYTFARFHHSELAKVSRLLSDAMGIHPGARIERFGSSPGGIRILNTINERIKLAMICFEVTRQQDRSDRYTEYDYGEVNIELLTSEKFRVILYPESPSSLLKEPYVISRDEGIYAIGGSISFLKDLYVACEEMRIPLAAGVTKARENRLDCFEFVPAIFKDDFIDIIFEVAANYPNLDLILSHVSHYEDNLFDWV